MGFCDVTCTKNAITVQIVEDAATGQNAFATDKYCSVIRCGVVLFV